MVQALRNPGYFTVEEYLDREQALGERCEFVNGVVYAMVGGTVRHNAIAQNVLIALTRQMHRPCEVFVHATKLRVQTELGDSFFYPDVMAGCDQADDDLLFRERPCLIVEVLSSSTESDDRRGKFELYRRIRTLRHYILVAQDVPQVEVFAREKAWRPEILFRGDAVEVCDGRAELNVDEIYEGISFSGLKQGDF